MKMCETFSIRPAVNDLIEWSIWITPVFESRRFYTRFFLSVLPYLPPEAQHESNEAVSTDWLRPDEGLFAMSNIVIFRSLFLVFVKKNFWGDVTAIEMYKAGQIRLIPPQFYTMTELSYCRDIRLVHTLRDKYTVVPMQPEFTSDDDITVTNKQTNRQANKQTNKQANKQNKQTNK